MTYGIGVNYISYSGYKKHEGCPYAYWHGYINKTRLQEPEDALGSLYGSAVGLIFEAFYRDKLWKRADCLKALMDLVEPTINKLIKEQAKQRKVLLWNAPKALYPNKGELIADVISAVTRGLQTIRENRLLGPDAIAELKLDTKFGDYIIGGRADFVMTRSQFKDLCILDGKGSKHREKYVDGHALKPGAKIEGVQLKWYALLYREKFKVIPDKLGYIFWKFGGKRAMDWVEFTERDLDILKDEVLATLARIDKSATRLHVLNNEPQAKDELRQELFIAQPSFSCTLCSYIPFCEEGKKKTKSCQRELTGIPVGVDDFTLGS